MARRTSIAVYHRIEEEEGLLSKAQWRVYAWLFECGPATAGEIAQAIEYIRNNTSARLVELKKMGVVEEIGERVCETTGNNVILWDVTDQLPVEPTKGPTSKTRKQLEKERDWLFDECVKLREQLARKGSFVLEQHGLPQVKGAKLTSWEVVDGVHSGSGVEELVLEFDNGRELTVFQNDDGDIVVWK